MTKKQFVSTELADIATQLYQAAASKGASKGDMIAIAGYFQSLATMEMMANMIEIQNEVNNAANKVEVEESDKPEH